MIVGFFSRLNGAGACCPPRLRQQQCCCCCCYCCHRVPLLRAFASPLPSPPTLPWQHRHHMPSDERWGKGRARGRVLRPSETMSAIVCGDDFFIRPRCKNRKSSATPDKAGPMGAFVGCWGEGRVGGGGVLLGLTGRKERGWARRDRNGIFFNASCKPTRTSLKQKKPGKNHAMQQHEQVLPPCRCIVQIDVGE